MYFLAEFDHFKHKNVFLVVQYFVKHKLLGTKTNFCEQVFVYDKLCRREGNESVLSIPKKQ